MDNIYSENEGMFSNRSQSMLSNLETTASRLKCKILQNQS